MATDNKLSQRYSKEEDKLMLQLLAEHKSTEKAAEAALPQMPGRTVLGIKYRMGVLKNKAKKTVEADKPAKTVAVKPTAPKSNLKMKAIELLIKDLSDDDRLMLIGMLVK